MIWAGHARVPVPLAPIDITLLKSYFLPSQLEITCTVFPTVILEEDVIFMVLYSDDMRHSWQCSCTFKQSYVENEFWKCIGGIAGYCNIYMKSFASIKSSKSNLGNHVRARNQGVSLLRRISARLHPTLLCHHIALKYTNIPARRLRDDVCQCRSPSFI